MTTATAPRNQYFDRATGRVRDERLFGDRLVRLLYSGARERAPFLFRALTGARASALLGAVNYDMPLGSRFGGNRSFLAEMGVDLGECVEPAESFTTARRVFERKIRYWETRPMPAETGVVVAPSDSRVVVGSFSSVSQLFLKEKFFAYEELLAREPWVEKFRGGEFSVHRLTPEKYHWNHVPVSGRVVDYYEIEGAFHACNPTACVAMVTPFSKNRRVVTVIDTDVPGGDWVGTVAMVEVVALMIGEIVQCYSAERYENPMKIEKGMTVAKGQPKSLFRPGSSTVVLLFEPARVRFAEDIVRNQTAPGVASRLSHGFGRPLVETDVAVRSWLARGMGNNWE